MSSRQSLGGPGDGGEDQSSSVLAGPVSAANGKGREGNINGQSKLGGAPGFWLIVDDRRPTS